MRFKVLEFFKFWLAVILDTVIVLSVSIGLTLGIVYLCSKDANAGDREQVIDAIVKAADTVEVPRELVLAVCWVESSYRRGLAPRLDGDTPSYGICQVKLATARYMDTVFKHRIKATPKRLQDEFVNAFYAAKYLKYQLNRYQGDVHKAIDAYNKGRVVSVKSVYVRKVMLAIEEYTE